MPLCLFFLNMLVLFYFGRSGEFALTGYVVPGCVENGAWMLWGNSSAAAVAVLARSFLDIQYSALSAEYSVLTSEYWSVMIAEHGVLNIVKSILY